MQYRIKTAAQGLDLDAIASALQELDPAALLDADHSGTFLRASTVLGEYELHSVFSRAGFPLPILAIERQPSECCGGCGG
ncbi:hypothetical protein [Pseudoxanthomonas mexicana]|uniref:hypothetical protein n=1 Tax=Pseudoxanthomonas mexicana TaxID=128785 RepID=UPI00398A94CE